MVATANNAVVCADSVGSLKKHWELSVVKPKFGTLLGMPGVFMTCSSGVTSAGVCPFPPGGSKALAAPFVNSTGANVHEPYLATITEVRELHTRASDRSCVHVEIDISGASQLKYETGDHVGIFAQNSSKAVEQAAKLLGLPLDTAFTLKMPGSNSG
jgi:hypothetical protein